MSDTALKSDALLKQAQTVFGEGRYDAALETLTHLILEYAFSPAAGAADELIAQILNDGSRRTNALRSPLKAGNSAAGQILLARAEDREGFPAAQRTANCELAVALNPHSAMAAAQLAEALAMSDDAKLRDLERAEQLAVFAATSDPDSWYVWNVRASVANQKNQREAAIQHQQKALELAPRNFKKLCAYKLSRLRL